MEWTIHGSKIAMYCSGAQVNADDCTVNPLQVATGDDFRFMILQHTSGEDSSACYFARLNLRSTPLKDDTVCTLRRLPFRIYLSENMQSLFVPVEHVKLVDCIVRAAIRAFCRVVVPPFECTTRESRCYSMLCSLLRQGSTFPHRIVIQCLGDDHIHVLFKHDTYNTIRCRSH